MPKSPPYRPPASIDADTYSLAGVNACGCITAALAVKHHEGYAPTTVKEVESFYADMAKTGRWVQWKTDDEIRRCLFGDCIEQHGPAVGMRLKNRDGRRAIVTDVYEVGNCLRIENIQSRRKTVVRVEKFDVSGWEVDRV